MICNNCGAHFDDDLPKCPYCGDFHYAGAQKEYMDKLENMKENLDTLEKSVPQMYTDELKTQVKHVRKIVLIIISILAVLMLLFFMCFHLDSFSSRDEKQVLLFTKETYPVADEYYEAGDYEGLLTFYHTSMSENENADFYSWDHYAFLICYENLTFFRDAAEKLDTDNFSDYDMQELLYCYISNHYYQKGYPMEKNDQELVSSFEEEMEAVIDSLSLTEEELKEFNDLLNANEYPSWSDIDKFSQKVYKRIY